MTASFLPSSFGCSGVNGCGAQPSASCGKCLEQGNLPFYSQESELCLQPPIDQVSLLAALQAQGDCISEENLQFGPRKLPFDARILACQKKLLNPLINLEGGLQTLSKGIVELKPCCPRKSIAEEPCPCLVDDYIQPDSCKKSLITYGDVGYVPEIAKCPNCVPMSFLIATPKNKVKSSCPCMADSPCSTLPNNGCSSCTYFPGNVLVAPKLCGCCECSFELC